MPETQCCITGGIRRARTRVSGVRMEPIPGASEKERKGGWTMTGESGQGGGNQSRDVLSEVRRWLGGQGYALEYEAAEAFRQAGFVARQGQAYRDGTTGKTRETDVVAIAEFRNATNRLVDLIVVVECKKSKHPWVVRRAQLDHGQQSWAPIASKLLGAELDRHRTLEAYMPLGDPTGIGVVQAFNSSDDAERADAPYRAISQAVAGARAALRKADGSALVYPVVVLDAPLFTLSYDEDGSGQVDRLEERSEEHTS